MDFLNNFPSDSSHADIDQFLNIPGDDVAHPPRHDVSIQFNEADAQFDQFLDPNSAVNNQPLPPLGNFSPRAVRQPRQSGTRNAPNNADATANKTIASETVAFHQPAEPGLITPENDSLTDAVYLLQERIQAIEDDSVPRGVPASSAAYPPLQTGAAQTHQEDGRSAATSNSDAISYGKSPPPSSESDSFGMLDAVADDSDVQRQISERESSGEHQIAERSAILSHLTRGAKRRPGLVASAEATAVGRRVTIAPQLTEKSESDGETSGTGSTLDLPYFPSMNLPDLQNHAVEQAGNFINAEVNEVHGYQELADIHERTMNDEELRLDIQETDMYAFNTGHGPTGNLEDYRGIGIEFSQLAFDLRGITEGIAQNDVHNLRERTPLRRRPIRGSALPAPHQSEDGEDGAGRVDRESSPEQTPSREATERAEEPTITNGLGYLRAERASSGCNSAELNGEERGESEGVVSPLPDVDAPGDLSLSNSSERAPSSSQGATGCYGADGEEIEDGIPDQDAGGNDGDGAIGDDVEGRVDVGVLAMETPASEFPKRSDPMQSYLQPPSAKQRMNDGAVQKETAGGTMNFRHLGFPSMTTTDRELPQQSERTPAVDSDAANASILSAMLRPQQTIESQPAIEPQPVVFPTALPVPKTPAEVSQAETRIPESRNGAGHETTAHGDGEVPAAALLLEFLDTAPESAGGMNPRKLSGGLASPHREWKQVSEMRVESGVPTSLSAHADQATKKRHVLTAKRQLKRAARLALQAGGGGAVGGQDARGSAAGSAAVARGAVQTGSSGMPQTERAPSSTPQALGQGELTEAARSAGLSPGAHAELGGTGARVVRGKGGKSRRTGGTRNVSY